MDDQEVLHQSIEESEGTKELPDVLTERLQESVQEIARSDAAADAEIAEAEQSGAVSVPEAQELRDRKKGCLIQVMNALSKAVPERFKPRLQAALARNEILEKSYIASIDPIRQHDELVRLREHYGSTVIDTLYAEDGTPAALSRAIGRFSECIDQAGYDHESSKELVDMIYRLSFMGTSETFSKSVRAESAYVLTEQALQSGNVELAADATRRYLENFDDDPGRLLRRFDAEEAERIAHDVLLDRSYSMYKRGTFVFDILDTLPPDKRGKILKLAATQLRWHTDDDASDQIRVNIAKRLLTYAEDKNIVFDAILEQRYSTFIKTEDPTEQMRLLNDLTDDQADRDRIFTIIRKNEADYTHVSGFDINAYVKRLPYTYDNTLFVQTQHEEGYITDEVYAEYGRSEVRHLLAQDIATRDGLERVMAVMERYGILLDEFSAEMSRVAAHLFGQGTIDRRLHSLLKKVGSVEMASDWEQFNHDMQTSERLGERTWRDEQSLIDVLQNHLDANDMKCGLDLATRIYSREIVVDMLEHGNYGVSMALGDMLEHKKRMDSGATDRFIPRHVDKGSLDEYEHAIEDVRYEVPRIEICLESPTGVQHWIPYDELRYYHASEGKMIGVRISDNGLGYDEQLNALFAPTKTDYPFLRGQFGQGAKMSMARLLAAGCSITTRSSCQILESGERIEWEGQPTLSTETNTLHFAGRKRRVYNSESDTQSGTTTEIMFGNAETRTAQTITHMLETRNGGAGLGRYVFEYLPAEVRASYIDAKKYENRTSPADWVRISKDTIQSGVVYVQGLEAPTRALHLAFSYDFKDKELFTGADRAWLENDKLKTEILHAWATVTDTDLIKAYHDILFGDHGFHNETYWVNDLRYMLRSDAKTAHEELLKDRLGLQESSRGVIFTTRGELQHYTEETQRLTNAGFIVYPVANISQESIHFFQYICGDRYILTTMEAAVSDIDAFAREAGQTNETISEELKDILTETRTAVDTYLRGAGLDAYADVLADTNIDIAYSDKDDNNEMYIVRTYKGMQHVGQCITLTRRAFSELKTPDSLEGGNREYARFLTEMSLLSIAGGAEDTSKRGKLLGQEVINSLLDVSISERVQKAAGSIRLEYQGKGDEVSSAREIMIADERETSFQSALRILLDKKSDYQSIRDAVETINDLCADGPVPAEMQPIMYRVDNAMCFDGNTMYSLTIRPSGDDAGPKGIDIVEIATEQIGEVNGIPLYVGDRAYHLGTVLLLPLDFNKRSSMVMSDGGNKRIISAYDTAQAPPDWRDDPMGTYSTEELFGEVALHHAHVSNGVLVIPIGANDAALVEERLAYAKERYRLTIESGGAVHNEELNRGKKYIETTLSTDYGEGKAWDNPIRIFGDIVQNHIDEGGVIDMQFEILTDRGREWIPADELKKPHHAEARISGVRIADNGRGYTTRQLTVLSESTKNGGGQRGKFGTGLKMLTASCVRQGFELQFSSRDWKATASSRKREVIQHGVPKQKDIVGFDMDWYNEQRDGSYTEVRLPDGDERHASHVWHKWTEIIDPRHTDERGHAGLERYVRTLRSKQDGIRIGPVTILPDEPGTFFEGGILIPGADKRSGKQYVFGYDIDADIVATQERDVIDPAKLKSLLLQAFKQLPPELCTILIRETFALNTEHYEAVPPEYTLIGQLESIAALRLAYFRRFGEHALLSSAVKVKDMLKYGYGPTDETLTEQEQAVLGSVIVSEEMLFDASRCIRFRDKAGAAIANLLEDHVPTTLSMMTSRAEESIPIPADTEDRLQELIKAASRDMADILNRVYESGGKAVLDRLLKTSDRSYRRLQDNVADRIRSPEAMIAYYEAVANGQRTIDVKVSALDGKHAFIHGDHGITFGVRPLQEANLAGGTAAHELTHLGTNFADYNTAFLGMLMLQVPAIVKRYSMPT